MNKEYKLNKMDGQNVLITGGLGFIGSNIAQKLTSLGAKVTILDACLDPYGWNFANTKEIKDKIIFVKGDIRDLELIKKLTKDMNVIFDCAAQISHLISIKEPLLDIDINCRGAMTVLEAVRAVNDKAKLVYAGTRGQIGKRIYSPIDEKHPTDPVDMNGIDKLAAEKYYMLYNRLYGIKTTSIRINNTYGERGQIKHDDYGLVNWWIRQALLNEQIIINGDGLQTRDFNYIKDVVDAMILVAQSDKTNGEIFMLGSGKETSIRKLIELILKTTDSKMEIKSQPWPKDRKSIEIGNFLVDFSKIKNTLGWRPRTDLEEGIRLTVEFYKKRLKEYL